MAWNKKWKKFAVKWPNTTGIMTRRQIVENIAALTFPDISNNWKKRMTIKEALERVDCCSYQTFQNWLNEDKSLRLAFEESREAQKKFIQLQAENNIHDVITWVTRLPAEKKVDISFKYLEKTHQDYSPKSSLQINNPTANFNVPIDELKRKILELSNRSAIDAEFEILTSWE